MSLFGFWFSIWSPIWAIVTWLYVLSRDSRTNYKLHEPKDKEQWKSIRPKVLAIEGEYGCVPRPFNIATAEGEWDIHVYREFERESIADSI